MIAKRTSRWLYHHIFRDCRQFCANPWYDESSIDPDHVLCHAFPTRFDFADAVETFEEWSKGLYFKPGSLSNPVKIITATQKAFVPFYQFDITCHTDWTGNAEFVQHDTTRPASDFSHSSPFRYPAHFDFMCFIANETTLLPEEVGHLVFPPGDTQLERTHLDPNLVLEVEVNHEDAIERIENRLRHEEDLRIQDNLKATGARKLTNLKINTEVTYNEIKLVYFPIYLLYYTLNGVNHRAVVSGFDGTINAERHYSRPKLFTFGALSGAVMYSMAMPAGGIEIAYQAGAALGTGALSMLLPLYRKSWKRSVVAGEDLNTKARTENERKSEAKVVNDLLDDVDETFKMFARRGKFHEEDTRRQKYQAYGEENPDHLYSQRHTHRRQIDTELYSRMGLQTDATTQQIREAFQAAAKKYHPDVAGGQEDDEEKMELFAKILEAFRILKDPKQRKRYDETGKYQGKPET